jgi:acyl-CoA thioester hydrolase
MTVFSWPVRVYWEDTDGGGIVYYANYLRFLERARTEWLRARGHRQSELAQSAGILFTVVHLEAWYRRPARLDDELRVSCEAVPDGRATLRFAQRITRGPQLLLEATTRVACLDARTLRPRRLPDLGLS